MITVLFIASSARSAQISTHLQAVLDARIEFVDDIDLGLKLVFDKRPQVVCIEDEIAGVSGESVAQHIRLLLGGRLRELFYCMIVRLAVTSQKRSVL